LRDGDVGRAAFPVCTEPLGGLPAQLREVGLAKGAGIYERDPVRGGCRWYGVIYLVPMRDCEGLRIYAVWSSDLRAP
jgi:hypothetical protein